MKGFFITGTDTEIGKTFFTAFLTKALRHQNIPALALKPILCGERTDAEILAQANEETLSLNQINPVYLTPPLSPYAASVVENKPFDFTPVQETLSQLKKNHSGPFLVEGIGGWMVPITQNYWVKDWAKELKLPILVVARIGLGTLNHTLLTIESIRQSGCQPVGIILNTFQCPDDLASQTNPAFVEDLTNLPVFLLEKNHSSIQLPKWLIPSSGE